MPTYDYKCAECEDVFEVTRASTDTSAVTCPRCGSAAKRVFTPVGVVFKGSGFHSTDYRSKPSEAAPKKDEAPAPCGADKPAGGACASCPTASD